MHTAFLALLAAGGCAASASQVATPAATPAGWVPADAAAGIEDPAAAALASEYWAWVVEQSPRWATDLGIHRFDDRIEDGSVAAIEKRKAKNRDSLGQAEAIAERSDLNGGDRTTIELLIESLRAEISTEVCAYEEWTLSPRSNPVTEWNYLPQSHKVVTTKDGENLLARYRQIPRSIDDEIANLRRGAKRGLFANAESTKLVVEMVDKQLAQPVEAWPLLAPATVPRPDWSAAERAALADGLQKAVETGIKPALARYRALLADELLPNARPSDRTGLGALPIGEACYAALARKYTTLERTPSQIHAVGLEQIAAINDQMQALGEKLFGTPTLEETLTKLRTDPALYFETSEEVEGKAAAALAAAKAKTPQYFGVLPKADCVVTRIPDYEAPYTTIAYYRPAVPDGSKPGEYFINVYEPKTRPRYEAEALAFHEAIPGHHLQIAISQELPAVPAFRKHTGMTAFVEGWALYTERLSEEMGLYTADLDRMGMLSYQAWRASRLVVDTGIHAMGWSREKAVQYMLVHTALAENNVRNEVDRYITWPGQALAYMTGQLEILRLRAAAQQKLGDTFDIKAFHDVVLSAGAVTLPILGRRVNAWAAGQAQ